MKISLSAHIIICVAFSFTPKAYSQSDTDRSRQEIRQVCAAEFTAYEAGPKDGITQNTIGILPTRSNLEELGGYRGAALQSVVEGQGVRAAGMLKACVAATRYFQVQKGLGDLDGARTNWGNFQNTLARVESQRKLEKGGQGATQAVVSSSSSSGNESAGCASTPQESFRRFNKEMSDFSQSKPNAPPASSTGSGARAQNQYAFYYGTEALVILEKYRSCLSAADYEANKKPLEGMRDNGRTGCERLSTSPGSCTATYPAGWPSR